MAFVHRFKYDVFISYAWVNDIREIDNDPETGWVTLFRRRLKERLEEKLGRKDSATFFVDTAEIQRNVDFQTQVDEGIRQSATIVVLFSPGYLASEACRAEIRLFAKTIRAGGGDPATS